MTNQHPITPPPELVQQWKTKYYGCNKTFSELVTEVAQYGADQELEECCEWVETECPGYGRPYEKLRAARRPSLNSIALEMLGTIERDGHYIPEITGTIRRALEQLDD
jgi:hypothetical protein